MNYEVSHMFYVPLINYKCDEWEQKKDKILNIFNNLELDEETGLKTDWFQQIKQNNFNYKKVVQEIFEKEINSFGELMGSSKVEVYSAWYQEFNTGSWHKLHNHGSLGYSAVCYVEFDKNEHQPTQFVSPFNNFLNGTMLTYMQPGVEEGMLSFFPSVIHHQVKPNKSKKVRKILAFNVSLS